MIDINTALEVAGKIDDRINLLDGAFSVGEDGAGGTDVLTTPDGKKLDAQGLKAGEYIQLQGMPKGETADMDGKVDKNGKTAKETGIFNMGDTKGALALGLYQQMTDTIAQGLTSTIDQGKKIDTQIKRTLNS